MNSSNARAYSPLRVRCSSCARRSVAWYWPEGSAPVPDRLPASTLDRSCDCLLDLRSCEGFGEEAGGLVAGKTLCYLLLRVAAHQHDRHMRSAPSNLRDDLLTAHARHGDVEQHAGDFVGVAAERCDTGIAICGDEGRETASLQQIRRDTAHAILVVDDQHGSAATFDLRLLLDVGRCSGGCDRRQQDGKGRALPRLAVHLERPAVAAH